MAKEQEYRVILAPGTSFVRWKADLQGALSKRNCLGHIFHNLHGIPPATMPQPVPQRNEIKRKKSIIIFWPNIIRLSISGLRVKYNQKTF